MPFQADQTPQPPEPKQSRFVADKPVKDSGLMGATTDVLNRGLVAATLGAPVDIAAEVMRPFGYKEKEPFLGSEYIGKQMEKAGMVSPKRRPVAEMAVGLAPSLVTGGVAGTRAGLKGVSNLVSKARKPIEEIVGGLKTTAEDIAGKAGKTSEDLLRTQAQRREVNLKEAEKTFVSEAQKASEDSAAAYSGLGKPVGESRLGDEMQRRLVGTEERLASNRARQAEEDSRNYFKQASAKNWQNSKEFKTLDKDLMNIVDSGKYSPKVRQLAANMVNDLRMTDKIEGVEQIFRQYNELATGPAKEGFDAVMQQAAGDISKRLSDKLDAFAPLRKEFRNTYRELSSPLDVFETRFGQKAVATEKAVPGQQVMMPSDYPKTYFKNRDTVNTLREQLKGDEAAVRKFANQQAVNELQGKNATQARSWLDNNKEWVDAVPGLDVRVAKYVEKLEQNEALSAKKLKGAESLSTKRRGLANVRQSASAENQKFIDDSLFKIRNAQPQNVPSEVERLIGGLRQKNLLTTQEADNYINEIRKVQSTAKDKADAAKKIRTIIGVGIGTGVAGAGLKYGLGVGL